MLRPCGNRVRRIWANDASCSIRLPSHIALCDTQQIKAPRKNYVSLDSRHGRCRRTFLHLRAGFRPRRPHALVTRLARREVPWQITRSGMSKADAASEGVLSALGASAHMVEASKGNAA